VAGFDYHQATSAEEALALLGLYGDDAHLMAGGSSLVLMLQQGLIEPAHVIGLRGAADLAGIRRTGDGGLELRALATHREVECSPKARSYCPALAHAYSRVATVRIRNQATVGGGLAHADPAQDPPPMLLALDAEVALLSPDGERTVPLSSFFTGFFQTALRQGELLSSVRLPPLPPGTRATYLKFLPRTEDDYATVSVAAALRLNADGRCEWARVALGAAGPVPLRARALEAALEGEPLTRGLVRDAAALVREEVDPLDDARGSARYKREMARVWVTRALEELLHGEREGRSQRGDEAHAG
jgi:carbon-monoxide dehydrogenase medium subunit